MGHIKGQAETPWHLIPFILYFGTRLIVLKYFGTVSFQALKSSMTISHGMKNEHLFAKIFYFPQVLCVLQLNQMNLSSPDSIFPTPMTFLMNSLLPRKKGVFTSPLAPAQFYLLTHSFLVWGLDPCLLLPATRLHCFVLDSATGRHL